LGELLKDFRRVKLYKNASGKPFLQSAVEVPASEIRLFQHKEAFENVQQELKDATAGRISKLNLDEL